MSRVLITTADERSWKTDVPVTFLGEWCRRFDRVSSWAHLDAAVARPFGLSAHERAANLATVKHSAAAILPELAAALNDVHDTAYSARYWEIVLGHWLIRCVAVVVNRYGTMVQALRESDVDRTVVFESSSYNLATKDSETFKWACNDDVWNHVLYARILEDVGGVTFEQLTEPLYGMPGFGWDREASEARPAGMKSRLAGRISRVLPFFSRRRDGVMVSTYLPLSVRLKLELSLGQVPQVWRSPPLDPVAVSRSVRNRFSINADSHQGFQRFLRRMLTEMIPTCYLEGYAALRERLGELPWPAAPRFIYAANNWDTDELFKVWTASHVERGTPYVTGQHGNNYGTHVWHGAEFWPERSTADRFITWGWSDGDPRNLPAFNFRVAGRKPPAMRADGELLLIELTLPHRTEPHDVFADFATYQEEQFRFAAALPARVRERLLVRLYGEYRRHPWRDDERWRARYPQTTIDTGKAPISSLIARSRLIVHSYDSTGVLEGLSLNVPLTCFWHGGATHLLPSARPHYDRLRAVGILHDTPESAARLVAEHWDNIREWWNREDVQTTRADFCEHYSRQVADPVRTLREALLGARPRARTR